MSQETKKNVILTGIKPTGTPHLGNYFGMMKPALEYQKGAAECLYFIADLHAFTGKKNPQAFREHSKNVVLDWLGLGLDPERSVFYRQSDITVLPQSTWLMLCHCPMGLLERAHAYKDAVANGKDATAGLFTYPVLMAMDILLYGATHVPVGKDQKQHIEIARDLAIKVHSTYKTEDIFVLPEAVISDEVGTLTGTDGRKMSKSYGNTIPIFADEKTMRKAIMGIKTGSEAMGEALDPASCTVFAYHELFKNPDIEALRVEYLAGSIGYGESKKRLLKLVWEHFAQARERRKWYEERPELVEEILQKGAQKANEKAEKTHAKFMKAVGLQ